MLSGVKQVLWTVLGSLKCLQNGMFNAPITSKMESYINTPLINKGIPLKNSLSILVNVVNTNSFSQSYIFLWRKIFS